MGVKRSILIANKQIMEKEIVRATALWVSRKTRARVKVEAAKSEQTVDQFINSLLDNAKNK